MTETLVIRERSEWTSILPQFAGVDLLDEIDGLPNFLPSAVKGVCIHFVGSRADVGNGDPRNLFERIRKTDMSEKKWSDIMYNLGVSTWEEGVWLLRGLINRGAANGAGNNEAYLSIVCTLGASEKPTDKLFDNLRMARNLVLAKYPNATEIVGHRDVRATNCPGNYVWDTVFNKNGTPKQTFWSKKPPVGEKPPFICTLPAPTLRLGEKNSNVLHLQNFLSFFNYYRVRVDGDYGPITRAAVMELQETLKCQGRYPFTVDGVYGPKTREGWCSLLEVLHGLAK